MTKIQKSNLKQDLQELLSIVIETKKPMVLKDIGTFKLVKKRGYKGERAFGGKKITFDTPAKLTIQFHPTGELNKILSSLDV